MNYYEISQKLKELLQPMYEMARINDIIVVNNEDVVDKDGNPKKYNRIKKIGKRKRQ